jgi:hypothetical protein
MVWRVLSIKPATLAYFLTAVKKKYSKVNDDIDAVL